MFKWSFSVVVCPEAATQLHVFGEVGGLKVRVTKGLSCSIKFGADSWQAFYRLVSVSGTGMLVQSCLNILDEFIVWHYDLMEGA